VIDSFYASTTIQNARLFVPLYQPVIDQVAIKHSQNARSQLLLSLLPPFSFLPFLPLVTCFPANKIPYHCALLFIALWSAREAQSRRLMRFAAFARIQVINSLGVLPACTGGGEARRGGAGRGGAGELTDRSPIRIAKRRNVRYHRRKNRRCDQSRNRNHCDCIICKLFK